MRQIKLIIFDLDGTLVNAYRAVSRSLNFALKKMGYSALPHVTIKRNVGWGDKNLISKFVKPQDVARALAVYRRDHQKALKESVLFLPGAKKVLKELKKKHYRLAIASNRPTKFTEIILKHLKVRNMFECVLCADKVKRPKPAADLLKGILEKAQLKPSQALYIGDMTIDITTGMRARVKTIAVATGSCTKKELLGLKPLSVIHHLKDLMPLVEKIG